MKFDGRAIVVSVLDPVPSGLRIGPDVVVVSRAEAKALVAGDMAVERSLREAVDRHDRERLRRTLKGER